MLFASFFRKKTAQPAPLLPPAAPAVSGMSPRLALLCRKCYEQFLNDYTAHGFAESAGDEEIEGHFPAFVLAMAELMTGTHGDLEAHTLAEQQRQKARRNYRQLLELAQSVLVDQRNYLLAHHINTTAGAMGFTGEDTPFSGMETENGQPCHAFACKLLADSSLGRGPAQGLTEDAITMFEHHLARRADTEIGDFLQVYQREHAL